MYALSHLQAAIGTWYWCVTFRRAGKEYRRTFADIKHGGSAMARQAAMAWRKKQLAKVAALTIVAFCQQQRSNNTSGVPGVHFLRPERQPLGIWQARIKMEGKAKHKTFSVLKHGYQRAYELAVAARNEMLADADDRLYLKDRTALRLAPKPRT
jgi:hypothetical protein